MKPINVFSCGPFDAAGVNSRFAQAWNKYGFGKWRTYFLKDFRNTGMDLMFDYSSFDDIKEAIKDTDIFIFNVVIDEAVITTHIINDWDTIITPVKDGQVGYIFQFALQTKKPIIFYLNGSNNVRQWSKYYNKLFDMIGIHLMCSTPDLTHFFPKAIYTPSFIDYKDSFWNIPKCNKTKYIIGHFPTDFKIKNTDDFIKAKKEEINNNIIYQVCHGLSYGNAINVKRDMDFTFDHLQGYYGINSLESASLGVINFVKLDDLNKQKVCEISGTDTYPWDLIENIEEMKVKLDWYLKNPEEIEKRKKEVRKWMENYWSPKKHCEIIRGYFNEFIRNNTN